MHNSCRGRLTAAQGQVALPTVPTGQLARRNRRSCPAAERGCPGRILTVSSWSGHSIAMWPQEPPIAPAASQGGEQGRTEGGTADRDEGLAWEHRLQYRLLAWLMPGRDSGTLLQALDCHQANPTQRGLLREGCVNASDALAGTNGNGDSRVPRGSA